MGGGRRVGGEMWKRVLEPRERKRVGERSCIKVRPEGTVPRGEDDLVTHKSALHLCAHADIKRSNCGSVNDSSRIYLEHHFQLDNDD